MKFTCLSRGGGYHFPPCHIVNISGFRVLIDCPMDLSALTIFSPIPIGSYFLRDEETSVHSLLDMNIEDAARKRQKIEKPLDANSLIYAEPWYKTVNNLNLWNFSFIDIVLVTSSMAMLGLPFLTRLKGFSAKIYMTKAAARIGQLMMEDLISMHAEFKQVYGPLESGFPHWMKWEELQVLPSPLRETALGKDGSELGGWMPLYSAADVKDCMQKIQTLNYAEEVCYNGAFTIKALSSGLEIGACNWMIHSPKANVSFLSSSVFGSAHAMDFDYASLQGSDLIIYSDFSPCNATDDATDNSSLLGVDDENLEDFLVRNDESLEEVEKLAFLCSCAIDSVTAGGSVLIPIGRLGVVLQLLEQLPSFLESSNLKVPIFIISSVAEDLMNFTNIIPEWLSKQRQEKLYSAEPLFAHSELIKENKIYVFPTVNSQKLINTWQEPCIVFSPHWSLRLGPVVHLLRRWCTNHSSLLVMEEGVDADLALLPFKPMAMKVLQCSFVSGLKLQKVEPLLQILQPKLVLFPEDLKHRANFSDTSPFSILNYPENETLHIPRLKVAMDLEIATDMATQLHWRKLKHDDDNIDIARLKGQLVIDNGKHRLLSGNECVGPAVRKPLMHWGSIDAEKLMTVLQKMGISGSVDQVVDDVDLKIQRVVRVHEPDKAVIEVGAKNTVISAADEGLADLIFDSIGSVLDGI